jgi:protein transport protein SFT1
VEISIDGGLAYDVDAEIDQLRSSVGRLKEVSSAIHEENRLTSQVMDSLMGVMETARLTLRQTMKKLDRVARKTRSNHVVYVVLFAFALIMGAYFWSRVSRMLRWLFP